MEHIKQIYEQKIETKENEHQDQIDQVRQDMAFVVASLNQGSSSDTIIDLQAKIKELEHSLDDVRADCDKVRFHFLWFQWVPILSIKGN